MSRLRRPPALLAILLASAPLQPAHADSVAQQVIDNTIAGFTFQVVDSVWGWVMPAGSSGSDPQLDAILGTLNQVNQELSEIEGELLKLNCSLDADFMIQYAGGIKTYYDAYLQFVEDMSNPNVAVNQDDISEWANCAVGFPEPGQTCALASSSVTGMLETLAGYAAGSGGAPGSVSDCIKATAAAPPAAGTLDDRPWYRDNVENITDWYLTINAQALVVLTEAWHYQAWKAKGSPKVTDPNDMFNVVCPTTNMPDGCVDPIHYYVSPFRPNLVAQMTPGGAPYSTDQYVIMNATSTDYAVLLARSIEAYNQAADPNNTYGCSSTTPGALTSADHCGPTVGTFEKPLPSVAFGPYGYGTGLASDGTTTTNRGIWFSSFTGYWKILLGGIPGVVDSYQPGTVSVSRFLCTMSNSGGDATNCLQANGGAGLQVGSKIVQFQDAESGSFADLRIGHELIRFIDGGLSKYPQPFTDWNYEKLLATKGEECHWTTPYPKVVYGLIYYRDTGTNDSTGLGYYDFAICYSFPESYDVDTKQDWFVLNGVQQIPHFDVRKMWAEYRWPVLGWANLTCKGGTRAWDARNPAGMPTLCGDDFDTWFTLNVAGTGPSTNSLTSTADATLYASAPNSNDGGGSYLSLRSSQPQRVVLGFDADNLRAMIEDRDVMGVYLMLTTPEDTAPEDVGNKSRAGKAARSDAPRIAAYPLRASFQEGDGDLTNGGAATGSGATWNCAEEVDPTDARRECFKDWPRPLVEAGSERVAKHKGGEAHSLTWDVTDAVSKGHSAWLLQLHKGTSRSGTHRESEFKFFSREMAEKLGDPRLAPRLFVIYND